MKACDCVSEAFICMKKRRSFEQIKDNYTKMEERDAGRDNQAGVTLS